MKNTFTKTIKIKKKIFISLLMLLSGCLRYVPSISELASDNGTSNQELKNISGEDAFLSFESAHNEKLQALINQRLGAIENNFIQDSYAIGAGDLIEVQVFEVAELSATERVGLDGKLNLPLIGSVDANNLSVEELRDRLTKQYDEYVRSPKVNVSIKEYQAHRVFVMGAVSKPGVYPIKRKGYLLLEVLSEAGGRTESAGSKITIIPKQEQGENPAQLADANKQNAIELDLDNVIAGSNNQQLMLPLISGDTIIVADQGTIQVDGEVTKPGSYKLSPKTTVSGAIAAAGGLTYSANVNSVELIRDFGAGQKATKSLDLEKIALRTDSDMKLRDGDLIRIPSDSGRFNTRQAVEVINSFFRVGVSGSIK